MKEKTKIKFKDLSGWLKTAVIISLIIGGYYTVLFVFGFIWGLLSVLIG